MKKLFLLVVSLMIISVALIGCGKGNDNSNTPKEEVQKAPAEAIGTWYSIRPDTLTIEDNGIYTSEWLTMETKSTYTVKDNVLYLKGMDGIYTFKVVNDSKQNTLYFKSDKSNLEYTYYDTKEKADKIIAEKKAAENEVTETEKNTQFKDVQDNLVGTWVGSATSSTIEFTADGKYKFKNFQDNVWNYTIIDGETLEIKKDTGETYQTKIKLTKTNTGYEMIFDTEKFIKK